MKPDSQTPRNISLISDPDLINTYYHFLSCLPSKIDILNLKPGNLSNKISNCLHKWTSVFFLEYWRFRYRCPLLTFFFVDDDWEEVGDEEELWQGDPILPEDCLFCTHHSLDAQENLSHMSFKHSFFIPSAEYLVDLEGLLVYLGQCKVNYYRAKSYSWFNNFANNLNGTLERGVKIL